MNCAVCSLELPEPEAVSYPKYIRAKRWPSRVTIEVCYRCFTVLEALTLLCHEHGFYSTAEGEKSAEEAFFEALAAPKGGPDVPERGRVQVRQAW